MRIAVCAPQEPFARGGAEIFSTRLVEELRARGHDAPIDEDFGMVPLEAFRARKPVVTTTDSGGPLDFVVPGETGWVATPDPASLAVALREVLGDEETARRYGEAGHPASVAITWDRALDRILS